MDTLFSQRTHHWPRIEMVIYIGRAGDEVGDVAVQGFGLVLGRVRLALGLA